MEDGCNHRSQTDLVDDSSDELITPEMPERALHQARVPCFLLEVRPSEDVVELSSPWINCASAG